MIDISSPNHKLVALSPLGSKNILKKDNLTRGKTEIPKWFYAYGLNDAHINIPWIDDLKNIIIMVPKNTIIANPDIYSDRKRVNNKRKNEISRTIDEMNRFIHN